MMVSNKTKILNLVMLAFIKSPHFLSLQYREKGWLIRTNLLSRLKIIVCIEVLLVRFVELVVKCCLLWIGFF